MFTAKKQQLWTQPAAKAAATTSAFVQAGMKKAARTSSGNGALKYSTTGNTFVDQFGSLGAYRAPRGYDVIAADCVKLWAQDPEMTVRFILFIRMITRQTELMTGEKTKEVQRGGGLKHEAIMRMIWLMLEHPDTFWKNIDLFISVSSWKDIFTMLEYDLTYHGWEERKLSWDELSLVILSGLENERTADLLKKYLPQLEARSKCHTVRAQARTMIAKWLADQMSMNYKQYRQLKSSGTAHTWQQLISKGLFKKVDFDSIHGKALLQLVSGKFLANHGLTEKYTKWIEAQPAAKFTGHVHELAMKINPKMAAYQKTTLNKQYEGLVQTARKNINVQSGLIVVRDTSGSMSSLVQGVKISCGDLAKSLGIFFGDMLDGYFKNAWIEFNSTAKMHHYTAQAFTDKWFEDRAGFVGSTNILSVANLFATLRRQVPEAEFPTGILAISDMEFNPAAAGQTNVEAFKQILLQGGFTTDYVNNFKIVLWNVAGTYYKDNSPKFETFGETTNVFYFSGFDGSIVSFLTGTSTSSKAPQTDLELFKAAMDQEVLNRVTI